MKVIVNGAGGHMGRIIAGLASSGAEGAELAASCDITFDTDASKNVYHDLGDYGGEADVVIDFSSHFGTASLMEACVKKKLPVVVCTTGQTEEELKLIEEASQEIPVFRSSNMSMGIAVLSDLVKKAAAAFPDADIEVIETHHNRKVDVPSGTALTLGNSIKEVRPEAVFNIGRPENGKREKNEIGFHSVRYGNEVGTHEVIISTGNETITLKHQSHARALFADGAMKAAAFLAEKPAGLYSMKDLLS